MDVPVVAVLGAGNRAHNVLRVTADKGTVRVKYLWDTSDHHRQWLKQQHDLDAMLPDSPQACLEDPEVDAVLLMTPQHARREYVEQILPTGKPLYMDKPTASTPADVQAIWRALLRTPRRTATGFSLRYQPGFRAVRQLIAEGKLGELTHIRACQYLPVASGMNFVRKWSRKRAASGGFVNEMGIHDIDALIWLSGASPQAVSAVQAKSLYPPRSDRPEHCSDCSDAACPYRCAPSATVPETRTPIRGINLSPDMQANPKSHGLDLCCYNSGHDLYDRGCLTIEMTNGVLATFEFNTCCPTGGRHYEILGTKGMVAGNLPSNRFVFRDALSRETEEHDVRGKPVSTTAGDLPGGDGALFAEFVERIRSGAEPAGDVRDAVRASMTVFAGERATTEGRRVSMAEIVDSDLQASLLGDEGRADG